MTLPFKIDGKALKAPRRTPPKKPAKPDWSDYSVKVPVDCDHCAQVAYETAMLGEPFPGMRKARRKRKQGDLILLLCSEHGRLQQELDAVDYAGVGGEARSGGQRYIA